jgi:cytosine/adenosine deaminase-related metal-dependent hydrolase
MTVHCELMTVNWTIRNAQIWDGQQTIQRDLYTAGGRIVNQPASGARVVDLDGYTIFPGLINAHDHLELNHYPRSKFRAVYDNAHQWGEDMNARLDTEPYKSLRAYPLKDRLFIGGLKNLLCGATTVAHHGPPHKPLFARDFPVRVLKQYGWAHSLHFNTEQEIIASYRKTPQDWPWFIHLAEGTDAVAASEYRRLKALGCVGPNTVIVHGVGLTEADIADATSRIRGLVWCPTTNHYLLGQTAPVDQWGQKAVLGSDSRLTAAGDWLDELRGGSAAGLLHDPDHWPMLLTRAASVLGLSAAGHLKPGARADWWIGGSSWTRDQVALIVQGGSPRIGDPRIMAKFPQVPTVAATLDGAPKAIHIDLARRIHHCTLKEPGLTVDALPKKRFWLM